MAREMERLFQHFKVKLSQTLFLGNFLGSETPEADPETRIHGANDTEIFPGEDGEVSN